MVWTIRTPRSPDRRTRPRPSIIPASASGKSPSGRNCFPRSQRHPSQPYVTPARSPRPRNQPPQRRPKMPKLAQQAPRVTARTHPQPVRPKQITARPRAPATPTQLAQRGQHHKLRGQPRCRRQAPRLTHRGKQLSVPASWHSRARGDARQANRATAAGSAGD